MDNKIEDPNDWVPMPGGPQPGPPPEGDPGDWHDVTQPAPIMGSAPQEEDPGDWVTAPQGQQPPEAVPSLPPGQSAAGIVGSAAIFAGKGFRQGFNEFTTNTAVGLAERGVISPETASAQAATDKADIDSIELPQSVIDGAAAAKALEAKGADGSLGAADLAVFTKEHWPFLMWVQAESMGQNVASMGAQAVTGLATRSPTLAAGAAGLLSGYQEYNSNLVDGLNAGGYDSSDPKQLESALANPEFMAKLRESAIKKAIPVGTFDFLSSLYAPKVGALTMGKLAEKGIFKSANSILARTAEHGTALGVELSHTALGEALGEKWSTGTISVPQIYFETLGDAGPGAIDVALQTSFGDRAAAHQTPLTDIPGAQPGTSLVPAGAPMQEPVGNAPLGPLGPLPPELNIPRADEAATQQGRSMFGISRPDPETGAESGVVEVRPSYRETETLMGAAENRFSRIIAVDPSETVMAPANFLVEKGRIDPEQVRYEGSSPQTAKGLLEAAIAAPTKQEARALYLQAVQAGARINPPKFAATGLWIGDPKGKQVLNWEADPIHAEMEAKLFGTGIGSIGYLSARSPNRSVYSAKKGVPWFDLRVLKQRLGDKFYPETLKGSGGSAAWTPHIDMENSDPGVVRDLFQRIDDPGQANYTIQEFARQEVRKGRLRFDLNSATFSTFGNFADTTEAELKDALQAAQMKGMPDIKAVGSPQLGMAAKPTHTTYELSDLDPTVVTFHDGVATVMGYNVDSPAETRARNAILAGAKVISELRRRLKIKNNIVIHYVNSGSPKISQQSDPNYDKTYNNFAMSNGGGMFMAGMDGTFFLMVGRKHLDPAAIYGVIAHEMGHGVAFEAFANASAHVRAQIFASYRRFLLAHGRAPTRDFYVKRRAGHTTHLDPTEADTYRMGGKYEHYGVQFEEWFAEQVARWLQTDRRPMGVVSRHFRETAHRVLQVLRSFWKQFPSATFRPEREIEAWLGSMWEGKTLVDWAPQTRAWFQRETVSRNEKWFGPGAVPLQAETVGMQKVVEALGPATVEEGFGSSAPASGAGGPGSPTGGPKTSGQSAQWLGAHADKFTWFHKWTYNIQQLASIFPSLLPLQVYRSTIDLMQNMANKIMGQADARVRNWRALGPDMAGRLSAFVIDMDQMTYLTPQEKKAGVRRWPSKAEELALAKHHGLSTEAYKVYYDPVTDSGIRDDFKQVVLRTEALAIREANRLTNPQAKAAAIQEAQRRSANLLGAPYFPHTRFGAWAVSVRVAGKLHHFETRETKREQLALAKELAAQYPNATVIPTLIPQDVRQFSGMPPWLMERLMQLPGLSQAQKDWMEQLRHEVAPAVSMRKHLMQRKNYAGFSREGMRVYSKYFFHHGRQIARLTFQEQLQDQVDQIQRAAKQGPATPGVAEASNPLSRIGEYLGDHLQEVMNPSKDWALLRSAAALFHLGLVPASAALNLMQIPMVAGPYLGAKFGDARALKALWWGAKDYRAFYKSGNIQNMPEDQFKAMSMAIENGIMGQGFAPDLAAIAQGGRVGAFGLGQSVRERWVSFSEKAMLMFKLAEDFNRRSTFMAGWKLGMEADPALPHMQELGRKYFLEIQNLQRQGGLAGPLSPQQIMAYIAGVDAVKEAHYTTDHPHRARFMRGKLGALTTFYSFTLNTLLLAWNNKTDVMPRMLLTMMFMAGPLGVVPDDIEELINFIIRKTMGKDFNVEREAREIVSGIVGADWADSILLGAGRNSFGIPWLMDMAGVSWAPRLDMSKSIALSRLLPLDVKGLMQPGGDFNKSITEATQGVAGAAFGPGFSLMQALSANDLNWYDLKRWEMAMPRALRSVSRAIRTGYEGSERDKNYNPTLDFDYTDHQHFAELAAMALGFNPTRRAQYYDRLNAQMEHDRFWQVTREGLMRRAFQSKALKMEEWGGVLDDIRDYNRNVPDAKKRITPQAIGESFARRMKQRKERSQPGGGSLDAIYPEVERHSVR